MVIITDGLGEKLTEDDGEGVADGEGDLDGERDGEGEIPVEGLCEEEGDPEGLGDAETDLVWLGDDEGLGLADGDGEAEGDWLYADSPSSVKACPADRESTRFLMSRLVPNLNDPGVPLSS